LWLNISNCSGRLLRRRRFLPMVETLSLLTRVAKPSGLGNRGLKPLLRDLTQDGNLKVSATKKFVLVG